MEGRAIARPNATTTAVTVYEDDTPSMEGRAIARPNQHWISSNGGHAMSLQWRAGQLPGRTGPGRVASHCWSTPSMEGRAIARPNRHGQAGQHRLPQAFNGGPGNCPAELDSVATPADNESYLQWRAGQLPGRTDEMTAGAARKLVLQWRAGQLPGRTPAGGGHGDVGHRAFNGGPGNCPAEPDGTVVFAVQRIPSMEGRAIARPNR